jgi:hypothetical protein
MEAHNAHTHLVQPNFHSGDYVLRAVPKMRQHKLSLTKKGPYVVDKVYANYTLRLRSMIENITIITHITRARIYRNIDHDFRQDMSAMKLTAAHNQFTIYPLRRVPVRTPIRRKEGGRRVCLYGMGRI